MPSHKARSDSCKMPAMRTSIRRCHAETEPPPILTSLVSVAPPPPMALAQAIAKKQ